MKNYILEHFDEALKNKWIEVYYQPVVRTITGSFCGAEALARWNDPGQGLLPPRLNLFRYWKRQEESQSWISMC